MILNDARFPLAESYGTAGGDGFRTEIEALASGAEERNLVWTEGLARWVVRVGRKQLADLERLRHFHRRVKGRGYGFRFRDPLDHSTAATFGAAVAATDQALGTGDGTKVAFRFVKTVSLDGWAETRTIRRVRPETVKVALGGVLQASGFTIDDEAGWLTFSVAPGAGVAVAAGFEFDRAARFDSDQLDISLDGFRQGTAASIVIRELREAT